jgi:hypothetical protein
MNAQDVKQKILTALNDNDICGDAIELQVIKENDRGFKTTRYIATVIDTSQSYNDGTPWASKIRLTPFDMFQLITKGFCRRANKYSRILSDQDSENIMSLIPKYSDTKEQIVSKMTIAINQ